MRPSDIYIDIEVMVIVIIGVIDNTDTRGNVDTVTMWMDGRVYNTYLRSKSVQELWVNSC